MTGAEMTVYDLVPKASGAETTESSTVPSAPVAETTESSPDPRITRVRSDWYREDYY